MLSVANTILSIASVVCCVPIIWLVIASLRWHGAENQARLALVVLGVPLLIIQAITAAVTIWKAKQRVSLVSVLLWAILFLSAGALAIGIFKPVLH